MRRGSVLAPEEVALLLPGPPVPVGVASRPWAAVRSGSPVVLVRGRDAAGVLRRSGLHTRTWTCRRTSSGAVLVQAAGRVGAEPGVRSLARRIVRGSPSFTVAARDDPVPTVLVAALGGAPLEADVSLQVGPDPRRRAVFVLPGAGLVVKVARGPDAVERGAREQSVLDELRRADVRGVPRPVGRGPHGACAWSCETSVSGRPLDQLPPGPIARDAVVALASWLSDLAAATCRRPGSPKGIGPDAPNVLAHGDLASGVNVLVQGGAVGVIDWETAQVGATPLQDLVPVLALGLARARGVTSSAEQAAFAVRCCGGHGEDGRLLLHLVEQYLRRLDVPPHAAGRLAQQAWRYQASMRGAHDELVRADGRTPVDWISAAEIVHDEWSRTPGLGGDWSALRSEEGH